MELARYRMLANDGLFANFYRALTWLLLPILNTAPVLQSSVLNHRNREGKSLKALIDEACAKNIGGGKTLLLCYLWYHIVPWEFELYEFEKQTHSERLSWLSDADRYMCCDLIIGSETYVILKNKYRFYELAKSFYKRSVYVYDKDTKEKDLKAFLATRERLFVKPLLGSLGRDTFVADMERDTIDDVFKRLQAGGEWMLEEAIVQSAEMAEWNETSVNTVRIPSFLANGEWHVLQPFFRTGRNGQIVDNAGAGGILSVVDVETGTIVTDGYDEANYSYSVHPDSQKRYKGWQVPQWKELLQLTETIHRSLPSQFRYVGFDFALTDKGWDLIEANWGQFVGQIAAKKGIKREFDKYMDLR